MFCPLTSVLPPTTLRDQWMPPDPPHSAEYQASSRLASRPATYPAIAPESPQTSAAVAPANPHNSTDRAATKIDANSPMASSRCTSSQPDSRLPSLQVIRLLTIVTLTRDHPYQ